MKKGFYKRLTGGILSAAFCAVTIAQASPVYSEPNQKKEPVQIVVVDKTGRDGRAVEANNKSRVPQVKGVSARKDASQ